MSGYEDNLSGHDPETFRGLLRVTHIIYALHAFSVLTAVLGSAFIVWGFAAGLPSLIAVVLNYFNRAAVRGTWLESHFIWQIRTFWFAWLWMAVALLLFLTVIGIPLSFLLFVGAGIWVLYRVVRGWWVLSEGRPLPLLD